MNTIIYITAVFLIAIGAIIWRKRKNNPIMEAEKRHRKILKETEGLSKQFRAEAFCEAKKVEIGKNRNIMDSHC